MFIWMVSIERSIFIFTDFVWKFALHEYTIEIKFTKQLILLYLLVQLHVYSIVSHPVTPCADVESCRPFQALLNELYRKW